MQPIGKVEIISQRLHNPAIHWNRAELENPTKDNKKSYLSYLSVRFAENEIEEYDEDIDTLISLVKEIPVDDAYNALLEEDDDSVSSQADRNAGREEEQ